MRMRCSGVASKLRRRAGSLQQRWLPVLLEPDSRSLRRRSALRGAETGGGRYGPEVHAEREALAPGG